MGNQRITDSFSEIHSLAYSFIGYQTLYLATRWNPIFWNTAYLIVNSGSLEQEEAKEKTNDYAKVAKALGEILSRHISVSLVDINKSGYTFEPDLSTNTILFGLKALSGVNAEAIEKIKAGRPYVNFIDFMDRCKLPKPAMISLIKAGAFDNLEVGWEEKTGVPARKLIMGMYLSRVSKPKKELNMRNFAEIIKKDLLPSDFDFHKKLFEFNKYIRAKARAEETETKYVFDEACERFYSKYFDMDKLTLVGSCPAIDKKVWDKMYTAKMDEVKVWIKENQQAILDEINYAAFKEEWEKYAKGSISAWEMSSLCFYYHEHELKSVATWKYGIVNFFNLPENPPIAYTFNRGGKTIPVYEIKRIIGTVIGKNDSRSSISLLTVDGVVNVKFTRDYYAMFAKRISEVQPDGSRKIVEKGWMTRGTKLLVQGYRRDDTFVAKTYSKTIPPHQLYIIDEVNGGDLVLRHERKNGIAEDEYDD